MGSKMGKVKPNGAAPQKRELNLDLFAPGMTTLHRAGLAGLWMTLKRFEAEKIRLKGGSWKLNSRRVILRWDSSPRPFFESLIKLSFRVNRNGFLWFTALGDPMDHLQAAVVLHNAVLGTFLQHGKTRQADPSNKPTGAVSVEIDETPFTLRYQKVKSYVHQKGFTDFVTNNGSLAVARLAGWQFPGGVVRHTGFGTDTAIEEPAERVIPLLYAPVGAIYFRIRRIGEGVRPLFALVLPEISDLKKYAAAREVFLRFGVRDLLASGTADAGWRVLAVLHAKGLAGAFGSPGCRVISFGTVPWSTQQKTRVEIFTVRGVAEDHLRTFNLCRQAFSPQLVTPRRGEPFWDVPQTPGLVARNLVEGRSWYAGFGDFVLKDSGLKDREGKRLLIWHVVTARYRNEKRGLSQMVNEARFEDERERILVRACHEAWRRRMGRLGERARREGVSFSDLVGREFERLRVGFTRCKNASTLREVLTDFWARAGGPIPDLASGWKEILPLLKDNNWKKTRDLALLALASYQPESKEEDDALSRAQ
jgi:CRISPR-associated protein Cas8a1/Csx13